MPGPTEAIATVERLRASERLRMVKAIQERHEKLAKRFSKCRSNECTCLDIVFSIRMNFFGVTG